jgi:hypothetical protein
MLAISKKRNLFLSIVMVFALLGFGTISCTATQKGAGVGAGVGAGAGAVISALVGFDPFAGAAIGAGLGGLGGAIVGDLMDDKGKKLNKEEMQEARLQAQEMEGKYDSDIYWLRITRDANDNIKVVPEVKPKETKKLQFAN